LLGRNIWRVMIAIDSGLPSATAQQNCALTVTAHKQLYCCALTLTVWLASQMGTSVWTDRPVDNLTQPA
jgi:hypothetical protein